MTTGRTALTTLGVGAVLALTCVTAQAGVPDYQRVIKARSADPTAPLVVEEECSRTEIWVNSSDNMFGGRPGRVVKQGLTSVSVTRYDTCAEPDEVTAAAGGGKHGVIVFDGMGQTLDRLRTSPRLDRAWVDAVVPVLDDVSGRTVPVRVDLTWTLVGPLEKDTVHSHVRRPHEGIVVSHSQTRTGDAVVAGEVWIDEERLSFGPTPGAVLSQVKYGCQVILHPRSSGSDLSC